MIQPRRSRIVVVTAGGPHVWIIVNAIRDRLGEATVILEDPESKRRLLLRRAGKLGWIEVAGQLGTMVFTRLRKLLLSSRDQRNVAGDGTETELRAEVPVMRVSSADSPELTDAVRQMQAEVVLLAGCRLLSKQTLAAMSREICIEGVEDALEGRLTPTTPDMPSRQWYHPTVWFYLWTGLTRGVW